MAFTFSKVMPESLPLETWKVLGTRKFRIGMPSCAASTFSHGLAFISSKPERTMTFASRDVQAAAARSAGADEDGVVALAHELLHEGYFSLQKINPQAEDVIPS